MKKRNITLALSILSSVFILAFDFVKFDLIIRVKGSGSFGAGIVSGFLLLFPYILYGLLAIWSLLYVFKRIKAKKWRAFAPMCVIIVTIFLLGLFPYTKAYLKANYSINKEEFQKTIQLLNNGEMQQYQIGTDKFLVPYRLTSYSGVLYTDVDNGVTKVMFFAYSGFNKDVVIVYSSDDSGINENDFSGNFPIGSTWNFSKINKIDTNWYSSTIPA